MKIRLRQVLDKGAQHVIDAVEACGPLRRFTGFTNIVSLYRFPVAVDPRNVCDVGVTLRLRSCTDGCGAGEPLAGQRLHCTATTARGCGGWKRATVVDNAVQGEMLTNGCIEKLMPEATVGILLSIAPLVRREAALPTGTVSKLEIGHAGVCPRRIRSRLRTEVRCNGQQYHRK